MPVQVVRRADPPAVAGLLASVPEWFGIPEANAQYVADAGRAAVVPRGRRATRWSASRCWPSTSRSPASCTCSPYAVTGIARGSGACSSRPSWPTCAQAGVRLLEVHTVGPSHEDEGYARTREFYLALGFVAMNELQRIDWSGPTLILVRPL